MAKIKDPNRELAFKLWRENTDITNREIAKRLEVDEKKIATWKLRDKWKERANGLNPQEKTTSKKKNCSTTKSKDVKKCNTTNDVVIQQIEKETENNKKKIIEEISEEVLEDYGLTEKQRLFCIYYFKSFNAEQSAIKAGYSRSFARAQSYTILANVGVKAYLKRLKDESEQEDLLSAARILQRHKQIAFADLRDYIDENGGLKNLSDVDGTLIKKITVKESSNSQGYSSSSSIELEDRSKSLDFLNKFYKLDPSFETQREKINLERDKIKVQEERNRILENANKPITGEVKDMQKDEKLNLLKKLGGA